MDVYYQPLKCQNGSSRLYWYGLIPSFMRRSQIAKLILVAVVLALLVASAKVADLLIEYNWWREVGQVDTWLRMLGYQIAPAAARLRPGFPGFVGGARPGTSICRPSLAGFPPVLPPGSVRPRRGGRGLCHG